MDGDGDISLEDSYKSSSTQTGKRSYDDHKPSNQSRPKNRQLKQEDNSNMVTADTAFNQTINTNLDLFKAMFSVFAAQLCNMNNDGNNFNGRQNKHKNHRPKVKKPKPNSNNANVTFDGVPLYMLTEPTTEYQVASNGNEFIIATIDTLNHGDQPLPMCFAKQ